MLQPLQRMSSLNVCTILSFGRDHQLFVRAVSLREVGTRVADRLVTNSSQGRTCFSDPISKGTVTCQDSGLSSSEVVIRKFLGP